MSNNIKKIAFLDVDGVLLNFNKLVYSHLASAYGIEIPKDYIPKSWDFSDLRPKDAEAVSWAKVVGVDWPLHLKPFNNTKQFMDKLKKKGYHIILITRIGQSMQLLRIENLIKHGLPFDEIYFTSYSQIKADVIKTALARHKPQKWIFADDKAAACIPVLDLKDRRGQTFSIDYPFNKSIKKEDPKGLVWATDEQDLYQMVLENA